MPIAAIPAFLEQATAAALKIVPGARRIAFGHLGDGNIHFNFNAPGAGVDAAFLARWDDVQNAVHDVVRRFGGSISAEHGIGVMKREALVHYKTAAEIETMRALKRVFDPKNILNPGKVVDA